jgi:hypothetical protein
MEAALSDELAARIVPRLGRRKRSMGYRVRRIFLAFVLAAIGETIEFDDWYRAAALFRMATIPL